MRENVAERFFRELRADRIWEGTSEIQWLIIARGLRKRGLDDLLAFQECRIQAISIVFMTCRW